MQIWKVEEWICGPLFRTHHKGFQKVTFPVLVCEVLLLLSTQNDVLADKKHHPKYMDREPIIVPLTWKST
jgi:hypothetical protein